MQSWYDEVKDYTFPYPHECNPWCPDRCTGAMCTHYTQVKDSKGSVPTLPTSPLCLDWGNLLIFNNCISLTDSLGHDQQDWLCCACLQADECVGRDLGERCLPGLQLLPQVRQSSWALSSSPPKLAALFTSSGSGEEISGSLDWWLWL